MNKLTVCMLIGVSVGVVACHHHKKKHASPVIHRSAGHVPPSGQRVNDEGMGFYFDGWGGDNPPKPKRKKPAHPDSYETTDEDGETRKAFFDQWTDPVYEEFVDTDQVEGVYNHKPHHHRGEGVESALEQVAVDVIEDVAEDIIEGVEGKVLGGGEEETTTDEIHPDLISKPRETIYETGGETEETDVYEDSPPTNTDSIRETIV